MKSLLISCGVMIPHGALADSDVELGLVFVSKLVLLFKAILQLTGLLQNNDFIAVATTVCSLPFPGKRKKIYWYDLWWPRKALVSNVCDDYISGVTVVRMAKPINGNLHMRRLAETLTAAQNCPGIGQPPVNTRWVTSCCIAQILQAGLQPQSHLRHVRCVRVRHSLACPHRPTVLSGSCKQFARYVTYGRPCMRQRVCVRVSHGICIAIQAAAVSCSATSQQS